MLLALIISITASKGSCSTSRAKVLYLVYHEDYTLEEAKILPAPRMGKRFEIDVSHIYSANVKRNRKKLSCCQVLMVIALIFISILLIDWVWTRVSFRDLFLVSWTLLKMFWYSPLF